MAYVNELDEFNARYLNSSVPVSLRDEALEKANQLFNSTNKQELIIPKAEVLATEIPTDENMVGLVDAASKYNNSLDQGKIGADALIPDSTKIDGFLASKDALLDSAPINNSSAKNEVNGETTLNAKNAASEIGNQLFTSTPNKKSSAPISETGFIATDELLGLSTGQINKLQTYNSISEVPQTGNRTAPNTLSKTGADGTKDTISDDISSNNYKPKISDDVRSARSRITEITIHNLIPYIATSIAGTIKNVQETDPASLDPVNVVNNIYGTLNNTQKFASLTAVEIAALTIADFYTVLFTGETFDGGGFGKGVSIKEYPDTAESALGLINLKNLFNVGKSIPLSKLSDHSKAKSNDDSVQNRLNALGSFDTLGYILVVPFAGGLKSRVKIPFQNTPMLGSETLSAVYNNESMLHRSSELYNYTSSKRDGFSLTTTYYALAPYNNDMNFYNDELAVNTQGNKINDTNSKSNSRTAISKWSMDVIQDIENAYKSLTLPTYPNEDGSIQFRRPPFIKIVVGDINQPNDYVQNNLYRNSTASDERFYKSTSKIEDTFISKTAWRTIKTFVVSGVSIDKKMGENPYILNSNRQPVDTMGFEVSLTLLEVAPSYMDLEPDFEARIKPIENNYELALAKQRQPASSSTALAGSPSSNGLQSGNQQGVAPSI